MGPSVRKAVSVSFVVKFFVVGDWDPAFVGLSLVNGSNARQCLKPQNIDLEHAKLGLAPGCIAGRAGDAVLCAHSDHRLPIERKAEA